MIIIKIDIEIEKSFENILEKIKKIELITCLEMFEIVEESLNSFNLNSSIEEDIETSEVQSIEYSDIFFYDIDLELKLKYFGILKKQIIESIYCIEFHNYLFKRGIISEKNKIKYLLEGVDIKKYTLINEKQLENMVSEVIEIFLNIFLYLIGEIKKEKLFFMYSKLLMDEKIFIKQIKKFLNLSKYEKVEEEILKKIKEKNIILYNEKRNKVGFEKHELCYKKLKNYFYLFKDKELKYYIDMCINSYSIRYFNLKFHSNEFNRLITKKELIKEKNDIDKIREQI